MQTVPYTTVSNVQPDGLASSFVAQGHAVAMAPDGWSVDDAAAFQAFVASYPGSATQLAWAKTNTHSTGKIDQLAAIYLGKFGAGFNYTGPDGVKRTFQIDPTSQFNIDVQANASLGSIMAGEAWDQTSYFIAADNSHMATPRAQDMRAFALATRSYVSVLILNNRALKDAISGAANMAALAAIDINAGWPTNP